MMIGFVVFELHIPASRSLKEKRRVVKALIDRIHHRYRVSIAETGFQDLHQRAEIAVAAVTREASELEALFASVRRQVDELDEAVVTLWRAEAIEGSPA